MYHSLVVYQLLFCTHAYSRSIQSAHLPISIVLS